MTEEWTSDRGRMKRLRKAAFERQRGLCYWCSRPMILKTPENGADVWDDPLMCTGDHVLWRARGGKTTKDNIVAACAECNSKRHPPLPVATERDWPWLEELTRERVKQIGWGPW